MNSSIKKKANMRRDNGVLGDLAGVFCGVLITASCNVEPRSP
jgi:hypothetical protein